MRFNALAVISCVAALWHYAVGTDIRGESKPLGLAHRSASLRRHHHKGMLNHGASHHHVAVQADRKAVDGSVEDASQMRPIITGCLKECGYKDQTCITQCQVCIEQNECRILHKCDPCLQGAHDQMVLAKKTDKGILDSGGVALVRDGLMADMTSANLESLERKRLLRSARTGVLKAQREAEWAKEERQHSSKNLVEARTTLRIARLEVTRWKLQNEKKLKKMRAQAAEQRQERQKAERKLAAHKRAYSKAQKRLRVASKSNMSEQEEEEQAEPISDEEGTEENAENKTGTKETEGEEIYKLAKDVEERQTAVENAEREVEKTSADGEWLDRGLRRRVKAAQEGARTSREELLEARARERVSRERLEEAKDHYIASVKSSNVADEAAHDSEIKLRKAPVSLYPGGPTPPANASAKIKNQDKTAVVLPHSSALRLQGIAWLTPLAVLAVNLAMGV